MKEPVICPNSLLEDLLEALHFHNGEMALHLRMPFTKGAARVWKRRLKENERLIAAIRKRQALAPHRGSR